MNKALLLAVMLLLFPAGAYGFNTVSFLDGIIAYWPADEVNWNDATGNYPNATAIGIDSGQLGKIGNSWKWNGPSETVQTAVNINYQPQGSLSGWFNLTDDSTAHYITSGHTGGGNDFHVGCTPTHIQFYQQKPSSITLQGPPCVTDGWHHVVATWGPLGRNLYLDGVNVNYSSSSEVARAPANLEIGATASTGGASQSWMGTLDEIGFWNKTLSDKEVFWLFSVDRGCTHPFNNCTVNTLNISVEDEFTGDPLNNISLLLTGTEYYQETFDNNTVLPNFLNGSYNVRVTKPDFGTVALNYDLGLLGNQNLTILMSGSSSKRILYIKNINDYELSGAYVRITRVSDGFLIGTKTTDLAGSVFFYLDESTTYEVNISASGYAPYFEEINPVLSTYTIRLEEIIVIEESPDYTGVAVDYSPTLFYTTVQNNFSFEIISPDGYLTSYYLNVSHPGGSDEQTGVTATGESFQYNFTPVGADNMDYVVIRYGYDTTIGGQKDFIYSYRMIEPYNQSSFLGIKDDTFNLGVFERVLIGSGIAMMVAGIAALLGGAFIGGTLGLFLFGFFAYIGFMPWWSVLISMMVGFLWISWRGSGG